MPEPQAERGCFQERLLGGLGPVPLGMSEHTFIGNEAPGGPCVSGVGSGRGPPAGQPTLPISEQTRGSRSLDTWPLREMAGAPFTFLWTISLFPEQQ